MNFADFLDGRGAKLSILNIDRLESFRTYNRLINIYSNSYSLSRDLQRQTMFSIIPHVTDFIAKKTFFISNSIRKP